MCSLKFTFVNRAAQDYFKYELVFQSNILIDQSITSLERPSVMYFKTIVHLWHFSLK